MAGKPMAQITLKNTSLKQAEAVREQLTYQGGNRTLLIVAFTLFI